APPDAAAVRADARLAALLYTAGVAVLLAARVFGLRRSPDSLAAPLLLPGAAGASLLGLVLHTATVETAARPPSAVEFSQGFLLGCLAGAVVLVLAIDPAELARRAQPLLVVAVALVFAALAVAGSGPGASGVKINLGPAQPLEAVKLAVVGFLAAYLGQRAAKLRWQRERILLLRWPRPKLLVPALAALVASFAGLYLVGDLGPTLILALVFLGMFHLATRASGWAVAALAVIGLLLLALAIWPDLAGSGHVATRLAMWRDPWRNGLDHGHQVGESLWAIAAGGFGGQGLAQASTPLPPAGTTDLALAVLTEQLGFAGLFLYLALLAAVVLSGLHLAARNRTPERVLLAAGVSLLVLVQWAIIHAGSVGLLPLTGVVVPFLSSGRSSMIAFLVAAAVMTRLAEGARERERSAELDELRRGVLALALAAAVLLAVGLASGLGAAVIASDDLASRGIVTRLRDGTVVHRQNPRLLALAAAIRRGAIEDRDGRPIAHNPDPADPGRRAYPLGDTMGTLLGAHPARVLLPSWALEARWNQRLRGFGERADAPRYADVGAGTGDARLPSPDLRPLAALLHLSAAERRERLRALDAAVATRSVRLSIDARLQRAVAEILAARVARSRAPGAAAAVIDVASGQVLARAQVPDLDPADRTWQDRLAAGDADFARRFWGVYGPGADRTGLVG
ncbi:MAG TPA: FtsW/RodA/SpoVE family cell cycle protein, partial [Kofleriaceae bacterium]|nr:FtsW/RodA/SpoVE family cell cycle protein [Kofleriaceae bacterium]